MPNRAACLPLLLCSLVFRFAAPAVAQEEERDPGFGWTMGVCEMPEPGLPLDPQLVRAPSAALRLSLRESLHPAVPVGPTHVFFAGAVEIEDAGRHRFGASARGLSEAGLQVKVGDQEPLRVDLGHRDTWTEWLDLPRGTVEVHLDGARPEGASLRTELLWEREQDRFPGFGPERIPSRFVRPLADMSDRGRAGRVLLETKGCTNCHLAGAAEHAVGARPGPDLTRVGARVHASWMLEWLVDPTSYRAHADMPRLFGKSPAERADAEAVVHALVAHADEPAETSAVRPKGELRYHELGCVACHGARLSQAELHNDPFLDESVPGAPLLSLDNLHLKWRRAELARYLRDPVAAHPDGRMPSFKLGRGAADSLASFLVPREILPAFQVDAEKAERGWVVMKERRCFACHGMDAAAQARGGAPDLIGLDAARGCLDPADAATPRYDLTAGERELLAIGIDAAAVAARSGAFAPLDEAARRMDALGCLRCHSKDGVGGVPAEIDLYFVTKEEDTDLGDEGRLPPDLSEVGAKLTTRWMESVLTGNARSRPWIATRMPHYGEHAAGLAELLAREVGVKPGEDEDPPRVTDERVLAGRDLMGRDKLSCVACHVYKDYPPNGSVGPDLTRFAERLRYDWFADYMRNPMRYKPGTRMPTFVGQDGLSTSHGVLGGDLLAQIDAMWCYFELGGDMPAPAEVKPAQGLPVVVGERPRVLRTFLEDAGSRGIAVGFPSGVHFAFDAEACRLVSAWRGEFLDASGAWAGRGGNVSGGRGDVLWEAVQGPPILLWRPGDPKQDWEAADARAEGYRFRGYSIEPDGAPVIEYSIGDCLVEERWTPLVAPTLGFRREVRLTGIPEGVRVRFRKGRYPGGITWKGGESRMESSPDRNLRWTLTPSAEEVRIVWRVEL